MTISYNYSVSTSGPWTIFKLLFRWRGSVWKVVLFDLFLWMVLYTIISVVYRCALPPASQRIFEKIVAYCNNRVNYIPLNFVLGFFVANVVARWMMLFKLLGFIENIALLTAEYVRGRDTTARMIRRNIVRYSVLAQVLIFRDISMRTRRRFPTIDTVVATGFMMPHEKEAYDAIDWKTKYWLPFQWVFALVYRAREENMIESDFYMVALQEEIKQFRTDTAKIAMFDMVPIPIIYPQVVCLAVHLYFIVCLIGRQYIIKEAGEHASLIDIYVPVMTMLSFVFYFGWLKVAEVMLNPFGEDDDDFECNALIDRNIVMALTMVDKAYDQPPEMMQDDFWDKKFVPLYSEETAGESYNSMKGSVSHVLLPHGETEVRMVPRFDSSPTLARKITVAVRKSQQRKRRVSVNVAQVLRGIEEKPENSLEHLDEDGVQRKKPAEPINEKDIELIKNAAEHSNNSVSRILVGAEQLPDFLSSNTFLPRNGSSGIIITVDPPEGEENSTGKEESAREVKKGKSCTTPVDGSTRKRSVHGKFNLDPVEEESD